jgi:hypothetical protein
MRASALLALGPGGRVEHHDLTNVWREEQPIDKDPLALVERRLHRRARDLVGLHRPRLDGQREADRHSDREGELEHSPDPPVREHR